MTSPVLGIHHITAIASNPRQTIHFYTTILGLRLVKKSVNQDDVATYHLFFGDTTGDPGMDLTFFTFSPVYQGERGTGQVTLISLAVPESSLPFWKKRFEQHAVTHESIVERFGKQRLIFYDHDNQKLELVGVSPKELDSRNVWTTQEILSDVAIVSFYSARLTVERGSLLEPVLALLGYVPLGEEKGVSLYTLREGSRAVYLELEKSEGPGVNANGTVHHIAFVVEHEEHQLAMREALLRLGLAPTPQIDRYYFKSVYFRTPGGILFELATKGPGFTADEDEKHLGTTLALPPFLENQREDIEAGLEKL